MQSKTQIVCSGGCGKTWNDVPVGTFAGAKITCMTCAMKQAEQVRNEYQANAKKKLAKHD